MPELLHNGLERAGFRPTRWRPAVYQYLDALHEFHRCIDRIRVAGSAIGRARPTAGAAPSRSPHAANTGHPHGRGPSCLERNPVAPPRFESSAAPHRGGLLRAHATQEPQDRSMSE